MVDNRRRPRLPSRSSARFSSRASCSAAWTAPRCAIRSRRSGRLSSDAFSPARWR